MHTLLAYDEGCGEIREGGQGTQRCGSQIRGGSEWSGEVDLICPPTSLPQGMRFSPLGSSVSLRGCNCGIRNLKARSNRRVFNTGLGSLPLVTSTLGLCTLGRGSLGMSAPGLGSLPRGMEALGRGALSTCVLGMENLSLGICARRARSLSPSSRVRLRHPLAH